MKWIGAILVICACGSCGLMMASNYRAEERTLRQLIQILGWISSELSYRMWPLPVLFRQVAEMTQGTLKCVLNEFADELDANASPDAQSCMDSVLRRHPAISGKCRALLSDFGKSLGRYDLNGQLQEIMHIQEDAQKVLEQISLDRDSRLRCYQTLGLCAGFGLAILLL